VPSCSSGTWRAGPPVYSDINFILLGIALERLAGRPLRELAADGFTFGAEAERCASTERWRLARAGHAGAGA